MAHYVYLVRHGEPRDAEHGIDDGPLSARGQAQAHAIGRRLAGVPLHASFASPLDAPSETAAIMAQYLQGPPPEPSGLLFDCIPSGPTSETPSQYASFFGGTTEEQWEAGSAQAADAADAFLTRSRERQHTLLVAHGFLIGWFVREVLGAPDWRWLTLQPWNGALTVLRVRTARPTELLIHNDAGHLPIEQRTGLGWSLLA